MPNNSSFAETHVLPIVMAFAAGVLAMDYARDSREVDLMKAIARERVYYAAQETCSPKTPYQTAVQRWVGGKLFCALYDDASYGRAPRQIAQLALPVLTHPLGEE